MVVNSDSTALIRLCASLSLFSIYVYICLSIYITHTDMFTSCVFKHVYTHRYRRQAVSDHTIAFGEGDCRKEVIVPKGTCVSINAFLLHREPKHWGADAERFNPHRFLEKTKRPVCAYMPFGAGPRACIGQNFAKLEAKVQLAAIVSRFNMHLTGQKVVPELNLTLRPRSGITALITHRQPR